MAYEKSIVCLANSRKYRARCVAGKEWTEGKVGKWIRPVSSRRRGEISHKELVFEDGATPQLLDVLCIQMIRRQPFTYQVENYLIDDGYYWEKTGVFPTNRLSELCDHPKTLWINGSHSYNGINDRISEEMVREAVSSSLLLICPDELSLRVTREWENKKKVRARFTYGESSYMLKVTDLDIESTYRDVGRYPIDCGDVYLCISLGEPFKGYCYKLVAAILNIT